MKVYQSAILALITGVTTIVVQAAATVTATTNKKRSLIVGGQDAEAGQFPYFIHSYNFLNREAECAGSLIWYDIVLTAAHCVTNPFLYIQIAGGNLQAGSVVRTYVVVVVCHGTK